MGDVVSKLTVAQRLKHLELLDKVTKIHDLIKEYDRLFDAHKILALNQTKSALLLHGNEDIETKLDALISKINSMVEIAQEFKGSE